MGMRIVCIQSVSLDVAECMTFHRLIKLCYGTTFVKDGDRDLNFRELVRLTRMANAFECLDAVKGCATALQRLPLDWEASVECIILADLLKGVDGMAKLAVRAQDALANALGFVHECYVPAGGEEPEELGQMMVGTPYLDGLRLNTRVKVRPSLNVEFIQCADRCTTICLKTSIMSHFLACQLRGRDFH
jgi:hypothetical protein